MNSSELKIGLFRALGSAAMGGLFLSVEGLAAGNDATIDFNRQWAEACFSDQSAQISSGFSPSIGFEDVAGDTKAGRARINTALPFSFVYGGARSSEFLDSWRRKVKEEKVSDTQCLRILSLTDPKTGMEVSAVCTIYLDTAGTDWTVYFKNQGSQDSLVIEQVKALDTSVTLGSAAGVMLRRLNGTLVGAEDWMPFDQVLSPGKRIEFTSTEGRVSLPVCPFYNLDWGTGGVITAFGWSGQWTGSVEWEDSGRLRMQAGMQFIHLKLRPGEMIRSPRIMQMHWSGIDHLESYTLFRRTMFSHIVPKIKGQTVTPPVVHLSTSFYELNDSNEQNVLAHLKSVEGLGFEMFWLDAYWTGPSGFPNSMGNYGFPIERVEPKDRFPNGLKAIGEAVERAGLKYLMWFEPERVAGGTYLAKEHPGWVMSPGGDGSGLYNLGIPEARKYMTDYLNAVIKAYKLSCLRFDYNLNPLPFWQFMNQKDPDRIGMAEIRYMEGLYQMWDDILAANPHLLIDNCASGGCRIDLETCSRSIPLWRTDATIGPLMAKDFNQAAMQNQVMTAGLSRYVPLSTSGQMGATPYLFRSAFNAGISFCEDVRPKDYARDLLKQGIAEGKRIRKYYYGDFYPLSEANTSPRDWCIMQYHRSDEQDGMIMAFRRDKSPYSSYHCQLRQIDPLASYQVTQYHTFDPENPIAMKGADLRNLRLEIDTQPGSVVVEYRKE